MKNLLIITILITLSTFSHSQNFNLIDKDEIKTYIEILASDSLEGRYTGTIGQKKAAVYLAKEYEKLGLEKFLSVGYFESFELQRNSWGSIYIKINDQVFYNNDKISYLGFKNEPDETDYELIFAGYGRKQDLESIKVKDKMVLVFTDNIRSSYEIRKELKTRGAKGILLANIVNDKQFNSIKKSEGRNLLRSRLQILNNDFRLYSDDFHVFALSNDIIKHLFGISVKKMKFIADNNSIRQVKPQIISLKAIRQTEIITTENIVGILPGISDTTIYISAHYDHVGKDNHGIYRGADDNASGTAAILELAEFFSKMEKRRYRMVFLAATAEEVGLVGSYIHVNSERFEKEKALVNFNIDMISRIDRNLKEEGFYKKNYLYAIGTDLYPNYKKYLKDADNSFEPVFFDYRLNNGKDTPWIYRASDHYSFHKLGIPAIMFFSGLHDDYHKITDTSEKIDYELLRNRITLIAHAIYQLQKVD